MNVWVKHMKRSVVSIPFIVMSLLVTVAFGSIPATTASNIPGFIPKHDELLKKAGQHPALKKQIWNLRNADIRAVIQTVSLITGKNFIVDPSVQGKITLITHKPMTPDELYYVFLSMLQTLHYSAVPAGKVIKIVPSINAKEYAGTLANNNHPGQGDQVVVRVVPVYNVSAAEMMPILRPLVKEWGSVSAYSPSNSLILAGTAANMKRLLAIVHNLDRKNANTISVITLKHANAEKLVAVLEKLQNGDRLQGKVSNVAIAADAQNNSILISGNLEGQYRMRALIKSLDKLRADGNLETVVVHLNYLNAKKFAPLLTKISQGQSAVDEKIKTPALLTKANNNISIQAEPAGNALIIRAPKEAIQSLQTVIKKLDVRPQQVLVEAIIVKVDANLMSKLGVVWGSNLVNGAGTPTGASNNVFPFKLTHGVGLIPANSLQSVMKMLLTNGSTDVLATPSIVMLNNQTATISDGKDVGVVNRVYSTNVADANNQSVPFNTIQRLPIVLSLKVTPQISPNNIIRLKIEQKNDTLDPNSADPTNPTINTSKINTSVLVRSGDILVLGGLINHDQIQTQKKVPLLGDIPILGNLFKQTTTNIEKKDLMVFIRPIVLNNFDQALAQTRKRYDYIRYQEANMRNGKALHASDLAVLPRLKGSPLLRLPPPAIAQ